MLSDAGAVREYSEGTVTAIIGEITLNVHVDVFSTVQVRYIRHYYEHVLTHGALEAPVKTHRLNMCVGKERT